MIAILLASFPSSEAPLDALLKSRNFEVSAKFQADRSDFQRNDSVSETLHIDADSRQHKAVLRSRVYSGKDYAQFLAVLRSSALLTHHTRFGLEDDYPAGKAFIVEPRSFLEEMKVRKAGEMLDSAVPEVLVGSGVTTSFFWTPLVSSSRTPTLGDSKDHLLLFKSSLMRWHHSVITGAWNYSENIQRVAGREMVAKVDKNQNVYVDMNELSRHRGWNFTISLEPARADVRIGNDHIKIYPGADRIHINDELVTLPGTVPTQGYGVYLPLRLLQERGYLPSEG
jgi:hypothetical protein